MGLLMLWIAAVFAVAALWWFLRRPATRTASRTPNVSAGLPRHPPAAANAHRPAPAPAASAAPPPLTPPPAELSTFQWVTADALPAERKEALLKAIRGIPRPPSSVQQLLSPDFLTRASSAELSELIMSEPIIAAKVLSAVNSPMYGLRQPVASLGQAVTFLGINSVRSICLQYMLAEAFKPKLAEAQKAFDHLWTASACASELAARLGKAMHWQEQGSLSTQVVLSFVGQLAMASMLPPQQLSAWLAADRLARTRMEQDTVGTNAVEVGALMMQNWELPPSLVEDVRGIGRVLVTPVNRAPAPRAGLMALCYLCSRWGEALAGGQMTDPDQHMPAQDLSADGYHLAGYMQLPALARLTPALSAPDLRTWMRQIQGQDEA